MIPLRAVTILGLLALAAAGGARPARGETAMAGMLRQIKYDQNLDAQVPLDLTFRDEQGKPVRLGDLLGKRPAILNLVYYECPMLCNEVLNSLLRSLNTLSWDAGKEFEVLTISIDPKETPQLASFKKARYLARYNRPGAERGWRFLTGDEPSIKKIAGVVGFHYVYDPSTGQYAHPAGIVVLTPQGKVARYFYGLSYPARDLRLGLIEASAEKIGSPIDQVLLYCFHYDPRTGKYNVAIMNVVRALGTATLASLVTFMVVMFRRDWRAARVMSDE